MKKENKNKIIIDLCGGTGSWSKPYKDAGYDVRLITLPELDVLKTEFYGISTAQFPIIQFVSSNREKLMRVNVKNVYGVLAAPPCTMFSFARTNAKKPRDLHDGMECVRACLDIIWKIMEVKQPTAKKTIPLQFWALENPARGFLKNFLGKPAFIFNPWEFGDMYKKETALWGNFNNPTKLKADICVHSVPCKCPPRKKMTKFDYLKSKDIHPEAFGKFDRQIRRSITPTGFAKAFFEANQ